MKNKRGISLIVLVITIIIIIILAGAVILNLADNNPIENASEAQILSDLDTFNSDLTVQVGQKYLKDYSLKSEDIDSDETKDGWHLIDLIPSIKGTDYEKILTVENAKLKLRIDAKLDDEIKSIIEKKLGKPVLTKQMIFVNPEKYIGIKIKYEEYNETLVNQPIEWRLFGVDDEGNLMIKAHDYIDLTYKQSTYPNEIIKGNTEYNIKSTENRSTLINYLQSSDNWNEYSKNGTVARGAMTLLEFVKGYNLVNDQKLEITFLNKYDNLPNSETKTNAEGYVIKNNNFGYFVDGITEMYNDMKFYNSITTKASAMWICSTSAYDEKNVYHLRSTARLTSDMFNSNYSGIMPVVSLVSASIVENTDGELIVE